MFFFPLVPTWTCKFTTHCSNDYAEHSFTAGLLGLRPALPWSEIDADPILVVPMFPPCMCQCVFLESRLLDDFGDSSVDTTCFEYVNAREAEWREEIRQLRLGVPDTPKIRVLWAELRYGW